MVALRNIENYAVRLVGKFPDVLFGTALNIHGKIVEGSPVDTGNFKINNRIAVNNAPDDVIGQEVTDQYTQLTREERKAIQHQISSATGRNSLEEAGKILRNPRRVNRIILFNNVDYAEDLEEGYSKQAPLGVYGISTISVEKELEKQMRQLGLL